MGLSYLTKNVLLLNLRELGYHGHYVNFDPDLCLLCDMGCGDSNVFRVSFEVWLFIFAGLCLSAWIYGSEIASSTIDSVSFKFVPAMKK